MNFNPNGDNFVFANAVMTVFFTSVFVIFPIAAIQYLSRNWKKVNHKAFNETYGELLQGLTTKRKSVIWYVRFEYLRKMTLTASVVFFRKYLWL